MREELIRHLGRGRLAYILPTGETLITLEVAKTMLKGLPQSIVRRK